MFKHRWNTHAKLLCYKQRNFVNSSFFTQFNCNKSMSSGGLVQGNIVKLLNDIIKIHCIHWNILINCAIDLKNYCFMDSTKHYAWPPMII